MVASHDPEMIDAADRFARAAGRDVSSYEYQMLYGIRDAEQARLVADGKQLRVYVPVRQSVVRILHASSRRATGEPDVLRTVTGVEELRPPTGI